MKGLLFTRLWKIAKRKVIWKVFDHGLCKILYTLIKWNGWIIINVVPKRFSSLPECQRLQLYSRCFLEKPNVSKMLINGCFTNKYIAVKSTILCWSLLLQAKAEAFGFELKPCMGRVVPSPNTKILLKVSPEQIRHIFTPNRP